LLGFIFDFMIPSALPSWLHWLAETPSTNTWAIDHSPQLHHGDVVFTPKQTAGRGQFDRVWQSPPGALTASFVLDGVSLTGLSLAVGLAVIYAIEDIIGSGHVLKLKWPNDIWYQQRKLAGILCEVTKQRVIVGIGCNLTVDFSQNKTVANAISLHQIQAMPVNELELLAKFRQYLLETAGILSARGFTALLPALRERDALQNQPIAILSNNQTMIGIGAGFSPQGHLLLCLPNHQVQSFTSGQVRLISLVED
jgi:BirA family transcriptional regulator, biotin operon repressor / biotin---[acetyl-CoA-carboxylase] ligase